MQDFFDKHGVRILAIAAAVAVTLCILSYAGLSSNVFRSAAGTIAHPFRSMATAVETWAEKRRIRAADNEALAEENKALRLQIAELEQKVRQAEADSEQNARLRELLSLKERRRDFVFEIASVIGRSSSNWSTTLTLDRGTADGVAVNDCVITEAGYLVGTVCEVGADWCTVRSVTDTAWEMGARVFRTGDLAVAKGDFSLMSHQQLKLAYLPEGCTLLTGDYIVTSGLGGFYPSGLAIGTVVSVRNDNGPDSYAVIAPLAATESTGEVYIIKDYDVIR